MDSLEDNCGLSEELAAHVQPTRQRQRGQKQTNKLSNHDMEESTSSREQETAPPPAKKSRKGEVVLLKALENTGESDGSRPVAVCQRVPVLTEKKSMTKKKRKTGGVNLTKVSPLSTGYEGGVSNGIIQDASLKAKGEVTLISPQEGRGLKGGVTSPAQVQGSPVRPVKSIYAGFESSKVIKMEQTSYPR